MTETNTETIDKNQFFWLVDIKTDQLQKDRQIVLRVLRVDRQVLRVDIWVLWMEKRVLRMDKRVPKVIKQVLWVIKRVVQVLGVASRAEP